MSHFIIIITLFIYYYFIFICIFGGDGELGQGERGNLVK